MNEIPKYVYQILISNKLPGKASTTEEIALTFDMEYARELLKKKWEDSEVMYTRTSDLCGYEKTETVSDDMCMVLFKNKSDSIFAQDAYQKIYIRLYEVQ